MGATSTQDHWKSGQISLGKGFAGKTLRVQRQADDSILLTLVAVILERQSSTNPGASPVGDREGNGLGCGKPAR